MKPNKILQDGKTEASALLFAHDNQRAQQILLDSHTEQEELRQSEKLEKQHTEFIDFVLKDWAAEIATEAAITLEFMDQADRDSIYKYAKAEEISELMEDAYQDISGMVGDAQQINALETRQSTR